MATPASLSTADRRELDSWLDRALDLEGADLAALFEEVPAHLQGPLRRLLGAETAASPLDSGVPQGVLESVVSQTSGELLAVGTRIGAWEIVGAIGRGGMGEVYRARRADGAFEREVALKVATVRHRDDERRLRLESERRILAGLSDPAIAGLLDGGVTTDGRPWFAMELVEGEPIGDACDRRGLSLEARLDVFERVAAGIEAAHRRMIVHRDLKPSNVLVTRDLTVKLLDFGIAGVLGSDGAAAEATGWLSPDYASPEMIRGEAVGSASDVYQLGVLLFQLVTGVVPVELGAQPRDTWLDLLAAPVAPSRRWSDLPADTRRASAQARSTTEERLGRLLRGDLGAILARATAPATDGRYETVGLLVEDLRRWRSGLPVRAVGDGFDYRVRRFVGRHRWAVAATAAVLVGGGAFAALSGLRLAEQERAARIQATRAEAVAAFLADLFRAGDPLRRGGPEPSVRDLLDRGADRIDRELGSSPEVRDTMRLVLGQAYLGLGDTATAGPLLQQALEGFRDRLGDRHPDLGEVWLAMAEVARLERRLDDAESALDQALALAGTTETLAARLGVERARLARDRGDHRSALGFLVEARTLGAASRSPVLSYQLDAVEGSIYFDVGKHRQAVVYLERAVAAARGDTAMRAQLATALGLLAGSELYLGRPVRARAALREAVGLWESTLGPSHPETLLAKANLAGVLSEVGEFEAASALSAEVAAAAAANGDRLAQARAELAGGLAALGRSDGHAQAKAEALASATRAGALLASRFGSAATARVWSDIGDQLWSDGAEAEAWPWWQRSWQAAQWPESDTRRHDFGWREIRVMLGSGDVEGAASLLAALEATVSEVVPEGTLAHIELQVLRIDLDHRSRGVADPQAIIRLRNQLEALRAVDPRGAELAARDIARLDDVADGRERSAAGSAG